MSLFKSAPKSLCILRLSAIGDVCNTIAVVQSIQSQWPDTKITWITGKIEAQLLKAVPDIEVVVFNKNEGHRAYTKLWAQLGDRRFDALLHMQYAIRASIATLGIKADYKLGFDKVRSQDFQTLFTNHKVPSPKTMHVLDGLRAFAHEIGVQDTSAFWKLRYSSDDLAWAQEQLYPNKRNLVVVPAASKAYKNWTVSGYAQLVKHAVNSGWNVILAGSSAQVEIDLAEELLSAVSVNVLNLVGKSSLLQMLALLDRADLVIAPDTGPTHMANAMNTPVIGLYAHHNPKRTGPYNYLSYVVSAYEEAIKAETNVPIEKLDWRTRVKDENAMSRIKAEQVITMFDNVVEDFKLR
ncbi:glycosyltransferase family 9 protein [Vibrio superstes]|uniref:Glycosyl transferase n=1 Tax=Vibrio superstes NBRC 103154 TaxID=1219062 RepID=A0A511QLG4_9VIBR|nr:glycosyltransferase family 9 protein [Vibrio superstes]GEM78160.1 glycosyl transferase [Vibrio superstes NBRC 103154]